MRAPMYTPQACMIRERGRERTGWKVGGGYSNEMQCVLECGNRAVNNSIYLFMAVVESMNIIIEC